MVCRLCLNKSDDGVIIFSEEKIQKYITKFLQLEISPDDPVSKIICASCWQQLDNFQKFCLQIEEAQKSLTTLVHDSLTEDFVKDLSPVKEEEQQAEESNEDGCDNDDPLPCLDEVILKMELSLEEENDAPNPAISSSTETSESIPTRRLREKRKTTIKEINDKSETTEEEEEEEEEEGKEKQPKNKRANAKRKCDRAKKNEQNTPKENKSGRNKKLSRAMLLSREQDAIIKKYMKLTCDICSIDLSDFNDLQNHFRFIHNRTGYAVCCKKKLKNRGLTVDHINAHNNPDHFKCAECGKVMSDRFCMQRHMLTFHPTEELKTFQCSNCPEKLASQYLLDLHSIKHVPEDKCTFICKECGKGFPTNSTLNSHIKRKHSTAYDRMCEICAKLFRHKSAFERHMEEHNGIVHPQVQCTECGSWLKDKYSLRKHIHNKHDEKTHICNICGKNSTSKSALQSHIKYMHEISPTFKCSFCDKSFKKAIKLKEHVATHTGEVLYTCPHCPAKFNAKSNMHSHRKKMHRPEWEANRRCSKKEPKTEAIIIWQITKRLTPEQRLQIVEICFQNSSSYGALRQVYGAYNLPSQQLIRNTMDRFMTTFTLLDNINPNQAGTVRTEEAIAVVSNSVTAQYTCDNADILPCLNEESFEVSLLIGEQQNLSIQPTADSSEIKTRRVTRRSMVQNPNHTSLTEVIKEKIKIPKKEEIEEQDSSEDEDESPYNSSTDQNVKKRRTRSKKTERNNKEDNGGRSEKFLKNMKTTKENDAFIQKHMKLSCDICSINFPDFTKLKHHFRIVHQRRGYVVCCNRQLKKRGLIVDHIYVHNDPEYFKCTECGKVLSDRSCLQRHNILFHQAEELKTFQCSHCPKKFPTKKLLDLHIVHHNECTFMCSECGKGYPTKATMDVHFKRSHSTLCDRMCEICAKLIKGKAAFERHMEEHEGIVQPRVQCKECDSWLKDKNSLRKHMYSQHDGKTHNCKICGKHTPSYSALYSHMKYMHELAAVFQCTFCDKSFKKAIKLKEHVATHTGGFLYTCPHCPTTFNAKTNMHSHRKKMHREEWEANRRTSKKATTAEANSNTKGLDVHTSK